MVEIDSIISNGVNGYVAHLTTKRKSNGDKLVKSTIERYEYFIQRYKDKLFDKEIISDAEKILAFCNEQLEKTNSLVLHASIISYLQYIGYDEFKDKTFFANVRRVKVRANAHTSKRFLQSKVLSRLELQKLFADEQSPLMRELYSFCYDTAARRSEVFSAEYRYLTFFDDAIKHKKWIDKKIGAALDIVGKGRKTRRVYLHQMTVDMINQRFPRADYVGHNGKFKLYKLLTSDGKAYKSQTHEFYKRVVLATQRILDRKMHPHCFRHTKLTHLADAGCDALGLMAYAGHEDMSTVLIYLEISVFVGERAFLNYSQPLLDFEQVAQA